MAPLANPTLPAPEAKENDICFYKVSRCRINASRPSLFIIKLKSTSGNSRSTLCVCEVRRFTWFLEDGYTKELQAQFLCFAAEVDVFTSLEGNRGNTAMGVSPGGDFIVSLDFILSRIVVPHFLETFFIHIQQMHDGGSSSHRSRFGDEALYWLF